jgi:hypothetical protein
MSDLMKSIISHLKIKDVNEDNAVFKLFSKVSVGLCLLASVIVAATQFWGDPIHCDHTGFDVDSDTFEAHCWVHGSMIVKKEYQVHFDCVSGPVSTCGSVISLIYF